MKTNLIGLAVAAALALSATVFAQDCNAPQQVGGYVAQEQQWVPGHYEQVYVPFVTHGRFHSHGGRLESRWVAGYYAPVVQRVYPRPAYGVYVAHGYHPRGQARVGVHFGFR